MESLRKIKVLGHRVCMLSTPGNRPGWHYTELGALLAPNFDRFVCYEVEQFRRGRAVGEILGLLVASLMKAGVTGKHIVAAQGYTDATRQLSRVVGRDDLVVLLGLNVHECLTAFRMEFAAHQR